MASRHIGVSNPRSICLLAKSEDRRRPHDSLVQRHLQLPWSDTRFLAPEETQFHSFSAGMDAPCEASQCSIIRR